MDCGGENSVTADYLTSQRLTPAGIFLTHADSDHYGGIYDVLTRFPRARIYLPDSWDSMEAPEELNALLYGRVTRYLSKGDEVALSDQVRLRVLWPPEGFETPDDNDGSLAVRLTYGEFGFLMLGDLTERFDVLCGEQATALKVAHHGSKYATSEELLALVRPEMAVISVGSNAHGHPTPEVLARLEAAGARVYRTDESGAVTLDVSKEGKWRVTEYARGTDDGK